MNHRNCLTPWAVLAALALPAPAQTTMPRDLPDFSWAGYHAGEKPLPEPKATASAADLGGAGDGKADDTAALKAALAKAAKVGGAALVPPGRWKLTEVLRIDRSGVVLRGAGSGKTTLVCPKSLTDIRGASPSWSWSGGMVEVVPPPGPSQVVGRLVAPAPAGATRLKIAPADRAGARPGEWLELQWFNDRGKDTLLEHLYGGAIARERMGREMQTADRVVVREWVRVTAAGDGEVALAQPLRIDARPAWRVRLVRQPLLEEVGVEGLTFEFPQTPYPGHLREKGYNAILMRAVVNGWVRDVRTAQADSGVIVNQSKHVTVCDVVLRGRTMHHPLAASWSADCLFTRWRIEAPHVHGTTISWAAHGNVFSRGWGRRLAMDAHRAAPFQNLHAAITIADAHRPFRSGGSAPRGPHAARQNVYWNVRLLTGGRGIRIRGHGEWPLGMFVGFHGDGKVALDPVAGLRQQVLHLNRRPDIEDLHAHQLRRRLGKQTPP